MSISIGALMEAVSGTGGYYGGTIHDELPAMSLDECFAAASYGIMETRIKSIHEAAAHNEAMVEAAVSGSSYEVNSLVEGALENLKNKIIQIFEKIKKFLRSIIAKIKVQIDKIRLSGHQLYTKYKDKEQIKGKSFKGMEFEGYAFTKDDVFAPSKQHESDATTLCGNVIGKEAEKVKEAIDEFESKEDSILASKELADAWCEKAKSAVDDMKAVTQSELQFRMVEQLVNCSSMSESSWQSDLKTELYGEKKTLTYGTDFSFDTVANLLKDPANLEAIKTEYENIEKGVNKVKTEFERRAQTSIDNLNKKKNSPAPNDAENQRNVNIESVASEYTSAKSARLDMYSHAYAAINQVKTIKYNFEKAKIDQAKAIFIKMMSYKEPKSDNNDADDFIGVGDFDVEI